MIDRNKMRVCIKGEGSISASRDMLNLISIAFSEAAYHYEDKGLKHLAKSYRDTATQIYDRLNETGYYRNKEQNYETD